MKLIDQLREAASEAGTSNADLLNAAADQIEWYRIVLQEIADRNPCTCDPKDIEQNRSSPNCGAFLGGDDARDALGQTIQCQGRLARRRTLESYN